MYNEFKSVIAQRLVVEQILPIEHIGEPEIAQAEAMTWKRSSRAIEAAKGTGRCTASCPTRGSRQAAAKFGTAPVDYIYEQPPRRAVSLAAAEICRYSDFSCSA